MEDQETGYGELHLHLDGAITPRIAKKLAALQGIELPYEGEQLNNALSVGEDCQSLNEFLQCFDLPLKLLQTKEGISEEDQKKLLNTETHFSKYGTNNEEGSGFGTY